MSKSKSQLKREKVQKKNVGEVADGCENCNNTGLEPNVARDSAKVCPVCKGSPFAEREEVSVENEDEVVE